MFIAMLSLLSFAEDGTFRLTESVGDPDGAELSFRFTVDAPAGLERSSEFEVQGTFTYESTIYGTVVAGAGDGTVGPFAVGDGCSWWDAACTNGFRWNRKAGDAAIVDVFRGSTRTSFDGLSELAAMAFSVGDERSMVVFPWRAELKERDWVEFYCVEGSCVDEDGLYIGATKTEQSVAFRVDVREGKGKHKPVNVVV